MLSCLFLVFVFQGITGQNVDPDAGERIMSITMHLAQMSRLKREPAFRNNPVQLSQATSAVELRYNAGDREPCDDDYYSQYRTADGSCNNLLRPTQGKSCERFKRYLPPQYDDGFCRPRIRSTECYDYGCKTHHCRHTYLPPWFQDKFPCRKRHLLPSARTVSVTVHPPMNVDSVNTVMLMQWGQFLDHDLTAAAVEQKYKEPICCDDESARNGNLHPDVFKCSGTCFPISIVQFPQDRFFTTKCMDFTRSDSVDKIVNREYPREQKNLLTAFIDGSSVYGSNMETQERLRAANGRMKTSGDNLLPRGNDLDCIKGNNFCFDAGDDRVHVFAGLTALHIAFVRLHNTIVKQLDDNTDWDDERLFQETRKIVIAILQRITYTEFLPDILDRRTLNNFDLEDNFYQYDSSIDPSIASSFATAALRFGHTLIPDFLVIDGRKVLSREIFNNPQFIFSSLKSVVRGVLSNPAESADRFLTVEITDHLFESNGISFDLASLNIQRGRDHGLPPYNWFRDFCGLPKVTSFFSRELGSAGPHMYGIYRSVDDIDLFAGGLSEPARDGALLGPTFTCIIAKQFRDLKFGDRFWHETSDERRGFTNAQLEELRKTSLAQVLCKEIGLEFIQKNPFRIRDDRNYEVLCEDIPDIDLEPWYDN